MAHCLKCNSILDDYEDEICNACKRDKEIKDLKQENEEIRNSIDNCIPIDKAENEDTWGKINQLIENEIEQERLCNN